MTSGRLDLTRAQILAHRRTVGGLDERLPPGERSLRRAAWAGLQDSMPRAALLSIHARVDGTGPSTWEDRSLVQLWGPRFSAYVIAEPGRRGLLARAPAGGWQGPAGRRGDGRAPPRLPRRPDDDLRRGRPRARRPPELSPVRGAHRQGPHPLGWCPPADHLDGAATGRRPGEARLELARRFLHIFGPGTPMAFARWAGIGPAAARSTFETLEGSLVPVRSPIGDGWILATDEATFRAAGRAGRRRTAPPERRHVLPPVGSRSRDPRAGRRPIGARCGPRASGRAPSSSVARSSGRGDGQMPW